MITKRLLLTLIALLIIIALTIVNAIKMGESNLYILSSKPERFWFGAAIGASYVAIPLLTMLAIVYRSSKPVATIFRFGLWLPIFFWVTIFYDGLEDFFAPMAGVIYFSYGAFPTMYYFMLGLIRTKTRIKETVMFKELIWALGVFVAFNSVLYFLALVMGGLSNQGAGQ